MVAVKNMVGARVGRLRVVAKAESIGTRAAWLCRCDCGKEIVRTGIQLRKGCAQSSCGCRLSEVRAANGRGNVTHGMSKGSTRKLYDVHRQMLKRCYDSSNKDYPRYGGRGIGVCDEWRSVSAFVAWARESGYQEGLTIERVDVNAGYYPENCTWVENSRQSLNWERSHRIRHNGKTQDIRSWAKDVGINYHTLRGRILNYGWSVERALTEPVRGR